MKAKYKKTLGKLSERTIRRILLNDLNLPSYIAIKKPLLTKAHKEKRVRFELDKKKVEVFLVH
jgi:hypothetical protein